jgi:hypothetical protein
MQHPASKGVGFSEGHTLCNIRFKAIEHSSSTVKMTISDVINPRCYRNLYNSCLTYVPDWVGGYAAIHMDTIPKVLNHALVTMAICNVFLVMASWSVSSLLFLAAVLLGFQNASVLLMINNGHLEFSPRFLAPTDFMVGVGLGISIGGTILSFFLSLIFGRVQAFCQSISGEEDSCGKMGGSLTGVWWWSSLVFWLEVATCLLLAAGRHEISYLAQSQYQSIDQDGPSGNQNENPYQQTRENQQQQPNGNGFAGNYNNVPDVQTEGSQILPQSQQNMAPFLPQGAQLMSV